MRTQSYYAWEAQHPSGVVKSVEDRQMLALRDGGYRVPARTLIFQRVSSRAREYDRLFTDPKDAPTKYLGFWARAKNYIRYGTTPL